MTEKSDCRKFSEMLHLRLDEGLSTEDSKDLFAHLSTCESCLLLKKRLDTVMTGFSKIAAEDQGIPAEAASALKTAWHEAMKTIGSSDTLNFTSHKKKQLSIPFLRFTKVSRAAGIAAIFLSTFLLTKTMLIQTGQPDSAGFADISTPQAVMPRIPAGPSMTVGLAEKSEYSEISKDKFTDIDGDSNRKADENSSFRAAEKSDDDSVDAMSPGISERLMIPYRFLDTADREHENKAFAELRMPRSTKARANSSGNCFAVEPAMGNMNLPARRDIDAPAESGKTDNGEPEMASYLSHESSMPGDLTAKSGSLTFVILTSDGTTTSKDVGEILTALGAKDIRPSEFTTSGGAIRTFEARVESAAISLIGSRFEHLRSARMTLAPNIRTEIDDGPVTISVTVRETP